jgi:predicted outer membrane lipoprotein
MKKITLLAVAIATITTLALPAADDAKPKREKPTAEEIKKYDKDGDGKLSKEERAALNADKKKDAPAKK